jgi:hypothetical protein
MICEYIEAALQHAHYELISDEEPYYGEVPELHKGYGPPGNPWKSAAKTWQTQWMVGC